MTDYNWKPVDDRHPTDRELVACKCGDGSMFLGFCITPYSDCGSIKNWYAYPKYMNFNERYIRAEYCVSVEICTGDNSWYVKDESERRPDDGWPWKPDKE